MANIETMISWFRAREGKVTYSMYNRLGPYSYDCSSAVFFALIEAGFLPAGTAIGNTESLYRLEGSLLQPISRSEVKRGDIFVSGTKGGSSGANGHTGVFVSNSRIIHCTGASSINGIGETAAEGWMGGPPTYYYRLKGSTTDPEPPKTLKELLNMEFCYQKNNAIYHYVDGKIRILGSETEFNVLKAMYNQTTNNLYGTPKNMLVVNWTNNRATSDAFERLSRYNEAKDLEAWKNWPNS